MGKIPTPAIIAIVAVLLIGLSVAAAYFLVKPKQEQLTQLREELEAEKQVVAQRPQAEREKTEVDERWLQAQEELAALRERKSIRISMNMPLLAMTALWYEYRDDLPKAVENYFATQGVTITEGASISGPPLTPPTVPSTGFLQVPNNSPLNLRVVGPLAAIERLYRNLSQLPRIATIGSLALSGSGEEISATIPLSLYILVEGAESASPPPAPAASPDDMGAPPPGPPPGPGGGGGGPDEGGGGGDSDE